MSQNSPVVISIGYGRHMFVLENGERARMQICAEETAGLHMVVFTSKSDGLQTQKVSDKLYLYPTNSKSKFHMVWDAFQIAAKIMKTVDKNNRLIVTTQDPFEAGLVGYFLKKKFGIWLTIQEHADVFTLDFWRKESVLNQIRYKLGEYLLKQADVIRVVSKRIEMTLAKKTLTARITNLPVAIDIISFVKKNLEDDFSVKKSEEFWLLSVARFVPQKNFPLMIATFVEAYRKNPRLRLKIVGQGPEYKKIETEILREFKDTFETCPIVIEKWSDDVSGLMWQADAYLLTSNYEGWARVLIESLICELPIVTTSVGCADEVVLNEQHGLVVPVNDREALSEAMLRISTDEVFYKQIKANLKALPKHLIAGSDMANYGKNWITTLE